MLHYYENNCLHVLYLEAPYSCCCAQYAVKGLGPFATCLRYRVRFGPLTCQARRAVPKSVPKRKLEYNHRRSSQAILITAWAGVKARDGGIDIPPLPGPVPYDILQVVLASSLALAVTLIVNRALLA